MKPVFDRYGNELRCGDFVCFTASNGNWRKTPELMRVKISAFITDRAGDWIVPENVLDTNCPILKITASRVVKCY